MNRHHFSGVRAAIAVLVCSLILSTQSACQAFRGSQNVYTGSEGQSEIGKIVANASLENSLKIKNLRQKRLEDGRWMVQLELTNELQQHVRFQWAVDWFDASGFKVADATRHWQPVDLGGGGFTAIQLVAPTPAASTFKLQVGSPDEVH